MSMMGGRGNNPNILKFQDSYGNPQVGWMTSAGNSATGRQTTYDSAPAASAFSNFLSGRAQLKIGGMPVSGSTQMSMITNPAEMYANAKARGSKNPFQSGKRITMSPASGGGSGGGGGRRMSGGGGGGRGKGGGGSSRQTIQGITQDQIAKDQERDAMQAGMDQERHDAERNAFFRDTTANRQAAASQGTTLEAQQDANVGKLKGMMEQSPEAGKSWADEISWRKRFG